MKNDQQKEFILNGNLWHVIITLSWPAVLSMLLLGANTLLDGIFVGRFAEMEALAGISVALPPIITIIGLGVLIGTGAGTLMSISIGAEDKKTQNTILANVNFLTLVFSAAVMLFGLLFSEQTLFLMGGRGNALALANSYYRTLLWSAPLWIYSISLNNLIRSEGNMKTGAAIMAVGLLVNGCANYVLMVMYGMGIKGAALGTNIGMAVQAGIAAVYFFKKNTAHGIAAFAVNADKAVISKIISMGLAGFIMQFMGTIQTLLVLNVLTHYGNSSDIEFYGVVTRLFAFIIQPIAGFMFALGPVIGINFGADRADRVIAAFKRFVAVAVLLLLPCWIALLIFPENAAALMMENAQLTVHDIARFRIYMVLLPVMPLVFFSLAFFPSVNKGKISSVLGILQQVIFYIPVMLILPIYIGVAGVYYGTFIIELMSAVPVAILVLREFRLLRSGVTKWQQPAAQPVP
ncbi:MAG: MATE family efflux transporter [Treponema sp.]